MFIDIPSKLKITHGEFLFELVYKYKGEQQTIKDTIICDYEGYLWTLDGCNSRNWTCEFEKDSEYGQYIIDNINGCDLYIDKIDVVEIEIIEWKPSKPLKGNIK